MNIIVKSKTRPAPGSQRPARFHVQRGTTNEEIREIVRGAADEYGPTNQQMMEHEARRACVTHSGEFDCKKFEEAAHEIKRVMTPESDSGVKSST